MPPIVAISAPRELPLYNSLELTRATSAGPQARHVGQRIAGTIRQNEMKIRNQKLTTPTLIRILRRLMHRRAFQQRKAKPGTSHVEGAVVAAVASLERPSILISN